MHPQRLPSVSTKDEVTFNPGLSDGPYEASSKRRATDRKPEYDGPLIMLGLGLLGVALIGACLVAGVVGLWVWR
jgi:hypothetical protein